MGKRAAGILMPVSSLPSDYGIGCFSKSAYEFVDWLKEAGQTYWQILPLGPTSYGDSPYQSFSTFAGNPYFIDLDTLVEEGVLDKKDCEKVNWGKKLDDVDYEKIYKGRYPLLRKAYENSEISKNPDYQKFVAENSWWLSDYALFMAVKDRFEGVEWTKWAEDIRLRWNNAMDYYREELYFDIEFQQYMQFKFYEQWMKLKSYANPDHRRYSYLCGNGQCRCMGTSGIVSAGSGQCTAGSSRMPTGWIFCNWSVMGKSVVSLGLPQTDRVPVVDFQNELLLQAV